MYLKESLTRSSTVILSYKLRRVNGEMIGIENSEKPSTSSVWPSDHRKEYRYCAWSFYSLVQNIPKALYTD